MIRRLLMMIIAGDKEVAIVHDVAKLHVKHEGFDVVKTLPKLPSLNIKPLAMINDTKDPLATKSKVSLKASPTTDVKANTSAKNDPMSSKVLHVPSSYATTIVQDPTGFSPINNNSHEKKGSKIIENSSNVATKVHERDVISRISKLESSIDHELDSSLKSKSLIVQQPGLLRGQFFGFECTLYLTCKKFVCHHKVVINSRIVVIGASRAATSFLHTLMVNTTMLFINLTLISTNKFVGFQGSNVNYYNKSMPNPLEFDLGPSESFSKLGLDCGVKLIKGIVGEIDRKQKIVSFLTKGNDHDTKSVPYDWLVLATGLQDQTRHALGLCTVTHDLKGVIRAQELIAHRHELGLGRYLSVPPKKNLNSSLYHQVEFCHI
jgi:hypothetical protein